MKKVLLSLALLAGVGIQAMEAPQFFDEETEANQSTKLPWGYEGTLSNHDLTRLKSMSETVEEYGASESCKTTTVYLLNNIFEKCQTLILNSKIKKCVKKEVSRLEQSAREVIRKFELRCRPRDTNGKAMEFYLLSDLACKWPMNDGFFSVFWQRAKKYVDHLTQNNIQRGGQAAKANLAVALDKIKGPRVWPNK